MTRLALHLNDAGITVSDGQRITYREPGFAWLGDNALTTGNDAFAHSRIDPRRIQHRYWSELTTAPLKDRRFSHLSAADLASTQLEHVWGDRAPGVDELVVAVPPYMSAENLGLFLGIAGEHQLPVVALVDAAVAATRREYKGAVPVHIDLSLHRTTLTRMAQPGMAQADRTEVLDNVGAFALYDTWVTALAEAFVMQSRFDPLHTAETEQMLLDRLGTWLSEASTHDHIAIELEAGGRTYSAEVESLALIGAAAPIYQQIARMLRSLYRAEDLPAIQVTDRVARMPGLTEMLKARVGGEVFVLEAGATTRGALARCRGSAGTAAGVSLMRALPWDQTAVDIGAHVVDHSRAGVPTHLLFGHTAYELGNSPLVLGSQESGEAHFVALPAEMPGVSRRHCSVVRKNGQCVIEDHSRYGTFLNGHRIDGSSVLQVGDALRIGSPGYEFQLITTDTRNG
jgi:hypothetical protein